MIEDGGNTDTVADDGGAKMMASWMLLARIIVETKQGGNIIPYTYFLDIYYY